MLEKELIAASTEPLLLSILSHGESYGYAIIKQVHKLSKGQINWTDGMLYPVLHRLEKKGLIESNWRTSETGRKRRYYRIKKKGGLALKAQLQQWLTIHSTIIKSRKEKPCLT